MHQVYLSPATLRSYSYARAVARSSAAARHPIYDSNGRRILPPTAASLFSSLSPLLLAHYPEAIVLIDRGGADGKQTFAEAVELAAHAVADFPSGCCRCVGVIVANDRPGHELFPMAPPKHERQGGSCRRAPFPVTMVSQESGNLLKGVLALSMAALSPAEVAHAASRSYREGWWNGHRGLTGDALIDHLAGSVVVSLGASEHCHDPQAKSPVDGSGSHSNGRRFSSGAMSGPSGVKPGSGAHADVPKFAMRSGGWIRDRMLYGARTLPVKFVK